jgi:hypothetical protein
MGTVDLTKITFDDYVRMLSVAVTGVERASASTYRCRCVLCGDSKKNGSLKRLYLLRETASKPSIVYCHNCGYKKPAYRFFMTNFPNVIKPYIDGWDASDVPNLPASSFIFSQTLEEISPEKSNKMIEDEMILSKSVMSRFFPKYTLPIDAIPSALEYMRDRFVPEKYIQKMRVLKSEFYSMQKFRYAYFRDFVFIPFIDNRDNKAYYFHARKFRNLNNKFTRYLMCPYQFKYDISFYYNYFNVDPNKPIVVCESTFGAMSTENAISTNGIHKINDDSIKIIQNKYPQSKLIFAIDNEMVDNDGKKKMEELKKKGYSVFSWEKMAQLNPRVASIKGLDDLCKVAKREIFPLSVIERFTI